MNGPRSERPSRRLATAATRRQVMQAVAGGLLTGALVRNGGRAATVADGVRYWDYGAVVPILAGSYEDVLFSNGDVFFGPAGGGSGIPPDVDALFGGDSPALQVRFDRIVAPDSSRAAYVYQIQFADADGATAGYESLLATIVRSDAEDVTKAIKGLDAAGAYRLGFTGSDGQEISRISAAGRYVDTVIFLLDDRYGGRKNDVGPGRTTFAALAEEYELARSGERLPAHATLVPGILMIEGVNRIGYYPSYVGGVATPRLGADMAGVERSNPGVQDAIAGNLALTVESDQYAIFFAIRQFVDEEAQQHYFESVGDIYAESGEALGITWVEYEATEETAGAVRSFPAGQTDPAEGVRRFGAEIPSAGLVGVDVVRRLDDRVILDVGVFGPDSDDDDDDDDDDSGGPAGGPPPPPSPQDEAARKLTQEAADRMKANEANAGLPTWTDARPLFSRFGVGDWARSDGDGIARG